MRSSIAAEIDTSVAAEIAQTASARPRVGSVIGAAARRSTPISRGDRAHADAPRRLDAVHIGVHIHQDEGEVTALEGPDASWPFS